MGMNLCNCFSLNPFSYFSWGIKLMDIIYIIGRCSVDRDSGIQCLTVYLDIVNPKGTVIHYKIILLNFQCRADN